MNTAVQSKSFLDTIFARLIALVIALLLAFLIWSNWSENIKMALSGDKQETKMISSAEPAKPANPALEECLARRVGDVDQMKEDGILSDDKYAAFKGRAEDLCRAQNPGG